MLCVSDIVSVFFVWTEVSVQWYVKDSKTLGSDVLNTLQVLEITEDWDKITNIHRLENILPAINS